MKPREQSFLLTAAVLILPLIVGCATGSSISPGERWALARTAYSSKDYTNAIVHLDVLLADTSTSTNDMPAFLFFAGHAYMHLGQQEKAYRTLNRIRREYPSSWYHKALHGRWVPDIPDDIAAYLLECWDDNGQRQFEQ